MKAGIRIGLVLLALSAFCAATASQKDSLDIPDYVAFTEKPQRLVLPPSDSPNGWRLAFIDVETTGLVPGYHEMIDIGIVVTDLEGIPTDSLFLRINPLHPERASAGAVAVNAFSVARWDTLDSVSPEEAVKRILEFQKSASKGKQTLMVAYNSQFDASFLDHLFRSAGQSWRQLYYYYILDLPSMAWTMGFRDLHGSSIAAKLGLAEETTIPELHTGLTGAQFNARFYRTLQRHGRY